MEPLTSRDPYPEIVRLLRAQRLKLGWSQAVLVERLGGRGIEVSAGTISNYEKAKFQPKIHELQAWAHVLGLRLTIELGGYDEDSELVAPDSGPETSSLAWRLSRLSEAHQKTIEDLLNVMEGASGFGLMEVTITGISMTAPGVTPRSIAEADDVAEPLDDHTAEDTTIAMLVELTRRPGGESDALKVLRASQAKSPATYKRLAARVPALPTHRPVNVRDVRAMLRQHEAKDAWVAPKRSKD